MSELYLRKRLFNNIALSLLMGVGAVFLFNPGCSGGGAETSESSVTPDTPVTPTPPDKSDGPDSECSFPDFSEQCKTAKGTNYTCLPDGTCAECRAGMAGCPCVGTSTDLSRRYCLEGQGRCLAASSNPNYDDAFCSWCLPGAEYCPCVDGAKLKCADGLSCISLGDGGKVCLRQSCLEAGSSDGTSCLCEGGGGCDLTDEVCWKSICRSCPGSQGGCPCDDLRGCSREEGLLCEDAPGEVGVKRCSRATTCASLECDANRLCCDESNADLSMCDGVASGDRAKCLSECVPGWTSTMGQTCNECAEGYYGEDCSNECPGGASSPCSGQGTCSSSGVCECATGFSGAACDACAPGYFGQTCAPCPGGGANPCHGHGVCDDGLGGSGACDCTDGTGWELPDCAVCSTGFDNSGGECLPAGASCSPGCGDHGTCTGTNVCTCNPGWEGATCGSCKAGFVGPACAECPGGASNPCNGQGVCGPTAEGGAECSCVNWTGDACETCPEGFDTTGGNCVPAGVTCDPGCGANGSCTAQDTCTCSLGWTGTLCDQCDAGYFGASCSPCPGGAANPCNGNGTCADGLFQGGSCTCGPDWVGQACEVSANCGKGLQLDGETCVDINECDSNNGGCGDPSRVTCENAVSAGDLPTCTCKGNR
ncbi:MAG: hypothetical protein VX699_09995, partial [Myxococcota bacterium]|nr:hypothetical protein [Myxococcota bacterium]